MPELEYHNKIHHITKKGFKIYPKVKFIDGSNKFAVCVEDKKRLIYDNLETVGEYKHNSKTLNKAIESTVKHIYKKINP